MCQVKPWKLLALHATNTWQSLQEKMLSTFVLESIPVLRINKMLSCAGADRLQTGMRGAFGKPQGTCARVSIGQVLLSVRCKDANGNHAQEALRRAKFKFRGRQKIIVSRNWGFTKFNRQDYIKCKQEKRIVPDGSNAKLLGCHGPIAQRKPGQAFLGEALKSVA